MNQDLFHTRFIAHKQTPSLPCCQEVYFTLTNTPPTPLKRGDHPTSIWTLKIFALIGFLLRIINVSAQTDNMFFYRFGQATNFIYNPAYTGIYNTHNLNLFSSPLPKSNHYYQFGASYDGLINKNNAFGALFQTSANGAINKQQLSLFYCKPINISDDISLRFGVNPTFNLININGSQLPDSVIINRKPSFGSMLNIGIALKIYRFNIGLGYTDLTIKKYVFSDPLTQIFIRKKVDLICSYTFNISKNVQMTPMIMSRITLPINFYTLRNTLNYSVVLADNLIIKKILLLGACIKLDANRYTWSFTIGGLIKNRISAQFAYDYRVTKGYGNYSETACLIRYTIK